MSYPRDLDEMSTASLKEELERRKELTEDGKCHYCGNVFNAVPSCKMREVHQGKVK